MTENWVALARESALAAEHMAIGVTALGKADYAKNAYYGQAFFALSTGFERSAKSVLAVDYAIRHSGQFPPHSEIRKYHHDLGKLLQEVDKIAGQLNNQYRLPNAPVHSRIIAILSEFANNITRYYNIELLTTAPHVHSRTAPIQRWHDEVIALVLDQHYRPQHRERDEKRARAADDLLGSHSLVMLTSENKRSLDSLYESLLQSARLEFAKPYVRLYALQIARFIGEVASELGRVAQSQRISDIPALSEFYAIFGGPDRFLKSRKTWSIYAP